MKKRPWSVYYLVIFYGIILASIAVFFTAGKLGLIEYHHLNNLWNSINGDLTMKLDFEACGILLAFVVYGVWTGKSWGRSLSFIPSAILMVVTSKSILGAFTITNVEDISGWMRFLVYLNILLFIVFAFNFYVSLRPDFGRFCRVYPEKRFGS